MAKRRRDNGSAWYRSFDGCWYLAIDGKRSKVRDEQGQPIRGKDAGKAADIAAARIKCGQQQIAAVADDWTVGRVLAFYCEHLAKTASPKWAARAKGYCESLHSFAGGLDVAEFRPKHFSAWLETKETYNHNTQRQATAAIKAAFALACRVDDCPCNPMKGVKAPAATARITCFTEHEEAAIVKASNPHFADYFSLLIATGARPDEIARAAADDLLEDGNGCRIVLRQHKTSKKTGKPRIIWLSGDALAIVRKLMLTAPRGSGKPLARNTLGKQWSGKTTAETFRRIRKALRLPTDRCLYSCRHTFAQRILAEGNTIETLAELLGNTPAVAYNTYGKMWAVNYSSPLRKALGLAS